MMPKAELSQFNDDAKRFVQDVATYVKDSIANLSPSDALRVLFELDAAMYPLQGQKSIAYDNGVHTKHRHMRYHDFFVDRIRKDEKVLDLGCGNGALSFDIADKSGAVVIGIDSNPHHIKQATSQFQHERVTYIKGDIFEVKHDSTFDVVVMSNILEHLKNRVENLKAIIKKTACERILIRVPLFERDWRVPLKKELGVEWRLDKTHETEYTVPEFKAEMDNAGLQFSHFEIRWGEIWCEVRP